MQVPFEGLVDVLIHHRLLALLTVVLSVLAVDFIVRFCMPALILYRSLALINAHLRTRRTRLAQKVGSDLPSMVGDAIYEQAFAGPWLEYCKTLHPQRETDENGNSEVIRWRATALAEVFFTDQVLVDTPLRTEYFRHLPGILTGLGIIGTFRGLIEGLGNFLPSLDPAQMQEALSALITIVANAFLTSAAAIALAILFTIIERMLLTSCYRRVASIQRVIDRAFHAGVGEEYLERLVKASEVSATQALQIKDALVSDLKRIMAEETSRQIEAAGRSNRESSTRVAEVLVQRLCGPIDNISEAVRYVGASQGEAVHAMLVDVLVRFTSEINQTLGGNFVLLSEQLTETLKAMQGTTAIFDQLAASMVSARETSTEAVADRLTNSPGAISAEQDRTEKVALSLLDQIRDLFSHSQAESTLTLARLAEHTSIANSHLHDHLNKLFSELRKENASSHERTGALVGHMSNEIDRLIKESETNRQTLHGSISLLASSNEATITRMASGAEMLQSASHAFSQVGLTLGDLVTGIAGATDTIHVVTVSLNDILGVIQTIASDYNRSIGSLAQSMNDLKVVMKTATKDASSTSELVAQLTAASLQLTNIERQSGEYLGRINEVLAQAHDAFADNIDKTLRYGNARFHVEFAKAVDLLAGGIRELEHAIDTVPFRN